MTYVFADTFKNAEGIAQALTGDHHFEQAGFRILLGSQTP